jgi:serine/threonine-protein phosphatase 5
MRAIGVIFGPDVAKKFLENNNLQLLIRSHEVKKQGFAYQKGGKVLTVFSATNYGGQMGNKGAYVKMKGKLMEPITFSFDAVVFKIKLSFFIGTSRC